MKYENIIDLHTHSDVSFDGEDSCLALCERAIAHGGIGIAITDHCDIDDPKLDVDSLVARQLDGFVDAKLGVKGKIAVLGGIELGQAIYRKEESEKLLDNFNYDVVLGSIHNLENQPDFYFLNYNELDVDKLLQTYFEAELALAKWNYFDVLAHLTYPLRYIVGKYRKPVDLTKYSEVIDAILETLVYNKKALELNLSSLQAHHHETMPPLSILQRFHDFGGKYVTVGTDAHQAEKVCLNIDKGYEMLQACGYEHFTIFVHREPWLMPIR
ncbi:MAG: histidinol-phosphatase HisJ family protein [Eubacterium sp.]|nr:histidinol-phosphatase HisJ family protein [Eubacterium sp.]